jgi:hypothetical protein
MSRPALFGGATCRLDAAYEAETLRGADALYFEDVIEGAELLQLPRSAADQRPDRLAYRLGYAADPAGRLPRELENIVASPGCTAPMP